MNNSKQDCECLACSSIGVRLEQVKQKMSFDWVGDGCGFSSVGSLELSIVRRGISCHIVDSVSDFFPQSPFRRWIWPRRPRTWIGECHGDNDGLGDWVISSGRVL